MKKQLKSLLLVAIFACTTLPAWSQVTTEGKEFWVALNMTTGTGGDVHEPFICITTQHPGGSYTISNPADASFTPITGQIPATGYIKITAKTNPTSTNEINLNKWYPVGQTAQTISNQTKDVGLKISTTVDCSVYAGNRLPQSFDAANILPITALQTEYITQDYPGYDHQDQGGGYPVITILATENNTQVQVNPSSSVLNSSGTALITKTLNAGQVLYITGENRATLSGTAVTSDKKIAVFTGVNNTDVPGPLSARDHLYEQSMPIEYWGTHFVVTRSMKKDANRIRVTAKENGTSIFLDGIGNPIATINAGDTYEFELCSAEMRTQSAYTRAEAEGRGTEFFLDGNAHYLETSCPCAVYSYDVSEKYYISSGTSDVDPNAAGDPSMVWISPLEQQIDSITFGVMNTDKTTTHYVNIITPSEAADSLKVREVSMNAGKVVYGNNLVQPGDVLPVPGNSAYSYARIKLKDNKESVYTITSKIGFIAHVYGSGDKESYAYSAGSAAVIQGVKVNNKLFTDGYVSNERFCMGDTLKFDAKVGTDEIARVDWNFGDGITDYNSTPQVEHSYTVPGWYDVEADLYGHQVCTDEADQLIGHVKFSFRVVRQDTVWVDPSKHCLTQEEWADTIRIKGQNYLDSLVNFGRMEILNPDAPCTEPIQISLTTYGLETGHSSKVDEFDSAYVHGKWYYPETLPADGMVTWIVEGGNQYGCRLYDTCYVHIKTCLDMQIPNSGAHACQGDTVILPFIYKKGDIAEAHFIYNKDKVKIEPKKVSFDWYFELPTEKLKPDYYQATITVLDTICNRTLEFPIEFAIYYPSSIFKCKFNNVLAVYNKENNGGYEFTGYQWLLDGAPIPGATQSVYHLDTTFVIGQYYSVILTRSDGVILPSCAQMIEKVNNYVSESNKAPATKHLINQRLVIRKDEKDYNIYGQRMK
jgi:hypothetical protein